MPLFRDYNECKRIVSRMLVEFSEEGKKHIEYTLKYCERLETDADRCFALTQSLKKQLWTVKPAVDMGFIEYLLQRVADMRVQFEYEKVNQDE